MYSLSVKWHPEMGYKKHERERKAGTEKDIKRGRQRETDGDIQRD